MVISNSSPLIHLTRLGKIEYFFNLVGNINIPKAVFEEVVTEGKMNNYSEAYTIERFIKEEKIKVMNLEPFDEAFYPPLSRGELEALELAKQSNDTLIIDEKKGRNLAQILQIEHQTTLTTVFELLIAKIIDIFEYKSNLKRHAENSWISADVIQEYIEKGDLYGR
jgi:predicted nucleic acid-binding protein